MIEVLKQTSPVAVPGYPIPIPLKIDLFSRTKIPGLKIDFFLSLLFVFFSITTHKLKVNTIKA